MGVGKAYSLHETDDTRAKSQEADFEEILEKVKKNGGTITRDEKAPLYTEIGDQELEIGYQRIVEFTLPGFDFQLIRKSENQRLTGEGRMKRLEPMDRPRITNVLRRKKDTSSDWQVMDIDGMF